MFFTMEMEDIKKSQSQLYVDYPDWFNCDTKELPIRVNILDPVEKLSVQIHPDDAFAKQYNGGRGKPEAWVILDTTEDGSIQFGHYAQTKEEFIQKSESKDWEGLLKYLKAIKERPSTRKEDVELPNITSGHEVIIFWNYDQDCCWTIGNGSIDAYCDYIRGNITRLITPKEENVNA